MLWNVRVDDMTDDQVGIRIFAEHPILQLIVIWGRMWLAIFPVVEVRRASGAELDECVLINVNLGSSAQRE